jgi:hypothetical protein
MTQNNNNNNNVPRGTQPVFPRYSKRERLTIFVHAKTTVQLVALAGIYNESPGRIIDALVSTLYNAKAQKINYCISGKSCPWNAPFPDNLSISFL